MNLPTLGPAAWVTGLACSYRSNRCRRSPAARLRLQLRPYKWGLQDLYQADCSLLASQAELGSTRNLTGIWRKDKSQSDSMERAFDSVKLPWLYRKAVGFLNYLELEDTEEYFRTTLKAGGVMDVVEQYPWTGEHVIHNRRDKRKGIHTGKVIETVDGPQLCVEWDDPYGGRGTDTFVLSNNGRKLTQITSIIFEDTAKNCHYKTVYNRVQRRE